MYVYVHVLLRRQYYIQDFVIPTCIIVGTYMGSGVGFHVDSSTLNFAMISDIFRTPAETS
jgi:hypothetical protein